MEGQKTSSLMVCGASAKGPHLYANHANDVKQGMWK
jgi:hypothetical protein